MWPDIGGFDKRENYVSKISDLRISDISTIEELHIVSVYTERQADMAKSINLTNFVVC